MLDISRKLKYADLLSKEMIKLAVNNALKNKNKKRSDLQAFVTDIDISIEKIYNSLLAKDYRPNRYHKFKIIDRKPRLIYAPSFRDSVVQQLLVMELYPRIEKYLVKMNTGCRKEHGLRSNMLYIRKELDKYKDEDYYIHFDIKKFFYSIDHSLVLEKFKKITTDKDVLNLISLFLPTEYGSKIGIPIGNLLSQIIGLFFLNDLDHFIKRRLKIKTYIRYVDDFLLVGLKKEQINSIISEVESYLKNNLKLELSKKMVNKIKHGINFCGYRIFKSKIIVRKKNIKKFVNSLKVGKSEAIISLLEYSNKTSSYNFFKTLLTKYSKTNNIIISQKTANKLNVNYHKIGNIKI